MQQINFETGITVLDQEGKKGVRLLSMSGAELVEIRLGPHTAIPPHSTPMDVMFFVKRGTCFITLDGVTEEAQAGDAVAGPAGVPHGLENPLEEPAEVLVIKLPAVQPYNS